MEGGRREVVEEEEEIAVRPVVRTSLVTPVGSRVGGGNEGRRRVGEDGLGSGDRSVRKRRRIRTELTASELNGDETAGDHSICELL